MEIITGYTGENHVTSADDASLYRGILGQSDYVLDVGNKFAATIIDNNTVRIMDGDLIIQGHQARIRANDYNEVTIDNGTPGEKRNDLIVARYLKNTETGIESITLEVIKGTPGTTAVDPEIVQEDLTIGGIQRDYPLYRVSLNGLMLESVTSLFTVLPNFEDFMTHLADYAKGTMTRIILNISANSGDGVASYILGEEYVQSVVSSAHGIDFNLKNIPTDAKVSSNFVFISGEGMNIKGNNVEPFIFRRASNVTLLQLGIKITPDSEYIPWNTIAKGAIQVTIAW